MRSSLKEFGPTIGFVAFAVLLAVNALVTRRMLNTQTELGLWVIHTKEVEAALGQTKSLLGDAEISERGYLLTGDETFLAAYQSAAAQIGGRIDALAVLTADNPVQQRNVAELRPILRKKVDDMAQAASLSRAGKTAAARAAILSVPGTPAMDPVRHLFAAMSAEEARLGELRTPAYQRSKRMTVISIWLSSLVAVLGAAVLAWLLLSRRATRERHERQLREREESFRVTLTSIGDAVITTDAQGKVNFLNPEAERLTSRKLSEAAGKDIKEVFPIFNEKTGARVEDPVGKVIERGIVIGLANHSALKGADGSMIPIADSAAPIRDDRGELAGVVLVFRDVTENRHIERESRLLASIVESSEDAILSKDLNGIVTSWNQSAQRMFGYTAEEMVGQPVLKLYPQGREGEMSEILGRIKRGEQVEHYRTVRRRKDGTLLDVSLSVSPLRDDDGEVVGASKIVRDISAEVEAQKEVLVQRERLRVTLHSIGDAVVSTDALGRVSYLNPVAEHLTGWSSAEATGRPLTKIFRIVNEKTQLAAENPVYRVLRERKVVGLANHTVLIARDGREVCIADSAAPIRADSGEVTGVVLVFRDVTEERRIEREGRLLSSIVESSEDAILSKDLDGIVTSWNQSAQRMFGYAEEEMIGQPVLKLYPPGRESEMHQILGRIKSGGRVEHYRTVRSCKDGKLLDVSLSVSPLRDDDGEIVGASKQAGFPLAMPYGSVLQMPSARSLFARPIAP
ncbi:MAG TPA: PAS domain S-box protein [Terracidiphilus sp.]|jgi:PAS domain S-box-containing protein